MAHQYRSAFRLRSLVLAALAVLVSASAVAQWQWVDATGRKVFSDTAPPPGIPDKNIFKRPGLRSDQTPVTAAPAESDGETGENTTVKVPPSPASSGIDKGLEIKKKKAEAEELAEKKVEVERIAKARASNCVQANKAKKTYDSGVRIVTTNDKGEREFVDDAKRAAEVKRLESIIRSDCGPMPAQ